MRVASDREVDAVPRYEAAAVGKEEHCRYSILLCFTVGRVRNGDDMWVWGDKFQGILILERCEYLSIRR